MKIGIDAREIQAGVFTGIGRPLINFLNCFSALDTTDKIVLFSSQKIPFNFGKQVVNVVVPQTNTFVWDQWKLPKMLKKEGIDIFYSPYYKIPLLAKCKTISSILDLMYLLYPPYKKKLGLLKKLYYGTFGRYYAQKASAVLTCSKYSKMDIIRAYKINPDRITSLPLSLGDIYRQETDFSKIETIKNKYKIEGKYLLYLGNFKPHKNVKSIILAFKEIQNKFADIKLVLAGPKEHTYDDLLRSVQKLSLANSVVFTGKIIPDDEPHLLYCGAEIFIMPSFYEGFGLPPLEAMACGVPVIASNATSLPELVKDAGVLINPRRPQEIAEAADEILENPQLRDEMIHKGLEYAKEYSKEKVAKKLYEYIKKVNES